MSVETAYKLFFEGKIREAKRIVRKLLNNPDSKVLFLYAMISMRENNLSEADNAINQAVELNPAFYEAWFLKAKIEYLLGKYNDALESIERANETALELEDYVDYELYILKARILMRLGRLKEARAAIDLAKELNPYDDDVLSVEKELGL